MGRATDEILPQLISAAVVGALSPVAAMAAIALLGSRRPVANTVACLLGWSLVLVLVGVVVNAVFSGHEAAAGESAKAAVGFVIGLLLLGAALRILIGAQHPLAPADGAGPAAPPPATPGWMRRLDTVRPAQAFVIGAVLLAASPANVGVYLAAVQAIAGADLSTGTELVVAVLLVLCIDVCLIVPLVVYVAMPHRAERLLAAGKAWLGAHNRAVNGWSAAVFGVVLLAQSLATLL